MARQLPTLRSAMITTTVLITGSTADAIAQSTATYLSSHQQGIGALLITMTASCVLDRLNSIVNDTNAEFLDVVHSWFGKGPSKDPGQLAPRRGLLHVTYRSVGAQGETPSGLPDLRSQ